MTSFSCIWLLKTIFTFYTDVVDNNDFLNVFHVFGCLKQDLHFTWMLWIIMTSFSCIWLWKTIFRFYMMLWIIMTSFSCIWLLKTIFTFYTDVVDNNDFLNVFHVFGCLKQDLHFT